MLYAYNLFHLNLAYSAIENESHQDVIERCYWPLLNLAKFGEVPMGIELPGYTLERIAELDPGWVLELKNLLAAKKCELIGCGYTQLITPLVPAAVNKKNYEIGNQIYREGLGQTPQIVLINEQAFSSGNIDMLVEEEVQAVIMEWNNPFKSNVNWSDEWRYLPQRAAGTRHKDGLPIIWNESIGFQKFQRYAHGELSLADLLSFTHSLKSGETRAVPLYGNDVEVFDFRPGRYMTEATIQPEGEWNRIQSFYREIQNDPDIQIVAPSEILELKDRQNANNILNLQTAECPVPVKKQAKYNVVRWGLSGRDDLKINTKCWQIFAGFKNGAPTKADWKELCYLWSSDFRTHITESRWADYQARLFKFHKKWVQKGNKEPLSITQTRNVASSEQLQVKRVGNFLKITSETAIIRLNCLRGLALDTFIVPEVSKESLIGTIHHGNFKDIDFSADFFSGHLQAEVALKHKITDLMQVSPVWTIAEDKLMVNAQIDTPAGQIEKIWTIDMFKPSLTVQYRFDFDSSSLLHLRLGYATLNPTSFKREELFFATHNGGDSLEIFPLSIETRDFDHGNPVSSLVSSNQAIGITEGYFFFGDKQKGIAVECNKTDAAALGLVSSKKIGTSHFTRFCFSLLEHDDTSRGDGRLKSDVSFTIRAVGTDREFSPLLDKNSCTLNL